MATETAQTVTEVMTDNKFSVTAMTVKVGQPLTINAKNNGQAIHNWDLLDKNGVSGTTKTESAAARPIGLDYNDVLAGRQV